MKAYHLIIAAALACITAYTAEAQQHRSPRPEIIANVAAVAGSNPSWGAYAGIDAAAALSFGHLDLGLRCEALTAGAWTIGAGIRPKLAFDAGCLYFDGRIAGKMVTRSEMYDFVTSAGIGWKMKHLDAELGLFSRTLGTFRRGLHNGDEMIGEPYNLLYRIAFNLKDDPSAWDAFIGAGDFTDYEYERHWAPIFFIGGRYDFRPGLRWYCEWDCKPTGMFHLTATAYSNLIRTGIKYTF